MATLVSDSLHHLLGVSPKSDLEVAKIVERGLPTSRVAFLRQEGLTFTEVSEVVISPRTLKHRNARKERLSDEETDRLVRVGRIIALADTVFGNRDKALSWLRAESDSLDGRRPLSLLRTDAGGRLVESRLWQIDEGVFA
jgi:putative toxin-antitoxin system antitoxin component (TIGR02293 family)